jgi:ribosome-associated toxin RatA of RatAB toxin-antitoxin module
MSELTKRITIGASTDKVWEVIADFGNVASWAPTIVDSRSTTEVNRGVGARRMLDHKSGQVVEEVIVEWNEGHSLIYEIPNGFWPIKNLREVWSVEPSPEGSVVVVVMDFEMKLGPLGAIMDLLIIRWLMSRELELGLAGLKHHVETGEVVTTETAGLPVAAVM